MFLQLYFDFQMTFLFKMKSICIFISKYFLFTIVFYLYIYFEKFLEF